MADFHNAEKKNIVEIAFDTTKLNFHLIDSLWVSYDDNKNVEDAFVINEM